MTNSLITITLMLAALGQTEVRVRTLDNQSVVGNLVQLSGTEVVLANERGEQSFAASKLHSLSVNEKAAIARWKVQVTLTDGSVLNGTRYAVRGKQASIEFNQGGKVIVALDAVVSVRFRDQTGDLSRQWQEYAEEKASSDRIVLRRKADSEGGPQVESLDVMEGVIGDVSDATVSFDVGGGDIVPVKRERIEGLLYFRRGEPASPKCVLIDIDNSRWAIDTIESDDPSESPALTAVTPAGLRFIQPLTRVRKIDFAAGNLRYLAEMPQDVLVRETWTTTRDSKQSGVFAPLTGSSPEGRITIGGESKLGQTLWMPAKSAITVRVPAGFTRFQARVGIDDRVGNTDGAKLLLEADGKVLLDQLIDRESRLVPVDVDLQGARRVRITVDYGGQSFLGDQLVLCEAMFTK